MAAGGRGGREVPPPLAECPLRSVMFFGARGRRNFVFVAEAEEKEKEEERRRTMLGRAVECETISSYELARILRTVMSISADNFAGKSPPARLAAKRMSSRAKAKTALPSTPTAASKIAVCPRASGLLPPLDAGPSRTFSHLLYLGHLQVHR